MSRLVPVRATISRALRNPGQFLSGYQFARSAFVTEQRASGDAGPPSAEPGRLERFFDAHTEGAGIWKWRHYFPIYERHLARFVGRQPTVLEIGVYSGGSLAMWHHYFGPGTRLVGIDIEPACRAYATENTQILIGDQADERFLETVIAATPGGIDIVLDDGGHSAHQQAASLKSLLPHVRPGGVYLVEDIHAAGHPFHAFVAGLARNLHGMGARTGATDADERLTPTPAQRTLESISVYPFVAVIEKRQRPLTHLEAPKHGTSWQPFYE